MPFLTKGKTNWKYILIVLILAVIVGGGILVWTKKQEIPSAEFPEMRRPEKVLKEETANWKTYRNEEYGFEIKYPEDWSAQESKLPSLHQTMVVFQDKETRKKFITILILPYLGEVKPQEELIEDYINLMKDIGEVKRMSFDNYPAVSVGPYGEMAGILRIFTERSIIEISAPYHSLDIFNQMLSTFKFLE